MRQQTVVVTASTLPIRALGHCNCSIDAFTSRRLAAGIVVQFLPTNRRCLKTVFGLMAADPVLGVDQSLLEWRRGCRTFPGRRPPNRALASTIANSVRIPSLGGHKEFWA
jgi:hypothetical protein